MNDIRVKATRNGEVTHKSPLPKCKDVETEITFTIRYLIRNCMTEVKDCEVQELVNGEWVEWSGLGGLSTQEWYKSRWRIY